MTYSFHTTGAASSPVNSWNYTLHPTNAYVNVDPALFERLTRIEALLQTLITTKVEAA